MSDAIQAALAMIDAQLKELDGIVAQTAQDLNYAAGKERVEKWKSRTVPLLGEHIGKGEAQTFLHTVPGPSFTNDLLEEFEDEADVYRTALQEIKSAYKKNQAGAS